MSEARQRRFIRLKEWTPDLDVRLRPTPAYLSGTDGSLPDQEYRLRTDADGYILPPADDSTSRDNPTLLVLGDSLVESVYVPEHQRFVAAVEPWLAQRGVHYRCLNGGYSGATTLHLHHALMAKVGRRPNTTVLLVAPVSDAWSLIKQGGYWCAADKRYSPIVPPRVGDVREQALDLADIRAVLPLFIHGCRLLGLGILLGTNPHRMSSYDQDPWLRRRFKNATNYNKMRSARTRCNEVVRQVAIDMNVPCVDLETALSSRTDLFYDDLHMNVAGSEMLTSLVGGFLADTLPRHPGP